MLSENSCFSFHFGTSGQSLCEFSVLARLDKDFLWSQLRVRGKQIQYQISLIWDIVTVTGQVCSLSSQTKKKKKRSKNDGNEARMRWLNTRQVLQLQSTMRKRKI